MPKIGRNDPCHCTSGKKYKRCHGSVQQIEKAQDELQAQVKLMFARTESKLRERENQQGLGRPIISVEANGYRFVAINNRLLHSNKWRTFHDFLGDYIKAAIGPAWGNAEIRKPSALRHPIIMWYQAFALQMTTEQPAPDGMHRGIMTGAASAYLQLAYDLYALEHNVELQRKLMDRIRNHEKFSGARYEVFVAASFLRGGFDIDFENEDDRDSTHCEFVATHRRTGRKFSVEAKRRESGDLRIVRLLNNALRKQADHTRIVFIDLNEPENTDAGLHQFASRALRHIRNGEDELVNGEVRPPAYVYLTNMPWEHFLHEASPPCLVVAEGFRTQDFKGDGLAKSLREAINAREAHIEMHELMHSLKTHRFIPTTFDGELPEYAFNPSLKRLLVGERYLAPHPDGNMRAAVLTSASLAENDKMVYCAMHFDDDIATIHTMPLSDQEIEAWKRHPDTFFGQLDQHATHVTHPLQMYDFIFDSYKSTSTNRLLEMMAGTEDMAFLSQLDQCSLASVYAERMTLAWLAASQSEIDKAAVA